MKDNWYNFMSFIKITYFFRLNFYPNKFQVILTSLGLGVLVADPLFLFYFIFIW